MYHYEGGLTIEKYTRTWGCVYTLHKVWWMGDVVILHSTPTIGDLVVQSWGPRLGHVPNRCVCTMLCALSHPLWMSHMGSNEAHVLAKLLAIDIQDLVVFIFYICIVSKNNVSFLVGLQVASRVSTWCRAQHGLYPHFSWRLGLFFNRLLCH